MGWPQGCRRPHPLSPPLSWSPGIFLPQLPYIPAHLTWVCPDSAVSVMGHCCISHLPVSLSLRTIILFCVYEG